MGECGAEGRFAGNRFKVTDAYRTANVTFTSGAYTVSKPCAGVLMTYQDDVIPISSVNFLIASRDPKNPASIRGKINSTKGLKDGMSFEFPDSQVFDDGVEVLPAIFVTDGTDDGKAADESTFATVVPLSGTAKISAFEGRYPTKIHIEGKMVKGYYDINDDTQQQFPFTLDISLK